MRAFSLPLKSSANIRGPTDANRRRERQRELETDRQAGGSPPGMLYEAPEVLFLLEVDPETVALCEFWS